MKGDPSYEDLLARLDDLLAPCFSKDWPNVPAVRAEGVYVYGRGDSEHPGHKRHAGHRRHAEGKRYLDFLAGFGVCNAGHNHPRIVAAAREQMERGAG